METKPWYPKEYLSALSTALTEGQLNELVKKSPPLFVFNYLMIPSVLSMVTDSAIKPTHEEDYVDVGHSNNEGTATLVSNMTRATLLSYKLHVFGHSDIPALLYSSEPNQIVEGMVIFGLDARQRGLIHQFESDARMPLRSVRVEIRLKDGKVRTIDAGAFVWAGNKGALVPYGPNAWNIDTFLESKMYREMKGKAQAE